ncbi:MAG: hypothetical protein ACRCTI_14220 [Beijerinckiaceae bacterium]
MAMPKDSLTGVWHGLYQYAVYREPVYFVATLIDAGSFISGTTHESEVGESGAPLTLFAAIEGSKSGVSVDFTKTYDGSGGWDHTVSYEGHLNADCSEIEGMWRIGVEAFGRFLMIRSRGATEEVARKRFVSV